VHDGAESAPGADGRPGVVDSLWPALRSVGPALAIVVVQQVFFPAPTGIVVRGLIVGGLTALIALGMALVYRANRIINFAQADLGFAPAVLAYLLIDEVGVPWPVAAVVGLAAAVSLGGVTERVVIRRFFRAPRLLVTIATIGLSQVLAALALLLPRLWDRRLLSDRIPPPASSTWRLGGVVFDVNDLLALIVTPIAVAVVILLLRRTAAGIAVRASADSADRASLLGIPVHRLHTIVWAGAAALAYVTMFLRGGILGLPTGEVLGFSVLLRSLVALMLGRLTNLVAVTTSAVALGVLELGIAWDHSVQLVDPVLGVIVLVALVLQRRDAPGADTGEASAWRAAEEVRPIPAELARLPVVRWGRWLLLALVVGAAAVVPHVVTVDRSLRASALLIYALLGLSLVVLSGWGGHVSLGQVAFFAIGAAVAAWLINTQGADLFAALVVAAVAGALAAVVIGIPASRIRGLALAVTTFAFSLATTSYLLNPEFFDWVPDRGDRIQRHPLLGGLQVSTPTEVFMLALAVLVVVGFGVRGIRASRTGRVLVALRDNDRAAQAYGIDAPRARLTTFTLSGAIASMAGALFVHHQQAIDPSSYSPVQNLAVFTMVVVGGLSSVTGAVLGAVFLLGTQYFLPSEWQILASGIGVLAILWLAPGGLATLPFGLRDRWLRRLAAGHGVNLADPDAELHPDAPATPPTAPTAPAAPTTPATARTAPAAPTATAPAPATAPATPPAPAATTTATAMDGGPPAGSRPLLTVDGADVSYGPVQILFGVDLTVGEGEAVALLGTNGAGKSTLLRAVSGLLRPQRGTITFDGADITGQPAHRVAAAGLAQMPGGGGVFPSLTVAENLRTAGWLHRRRPEEMVEAQAEVDHLFPVLQERAGQRAGSLSGGQQQMLALAMVLVTRPRLLMIDELSLGLAPVVVSRLVRVVDDLRRRGTTVVLVDQSVNVALEVADRAVFLERGQVRFSGPTADLLDRPDLLRSVFLGSGRGPAPVGNGAGPPPGDHPEGSDQAAAPGGGGDQRPVLRAVDLSRSFDGVQAVEHVSIDVAPGEIVGVIGPNGAGKTTLFDLLSGFTPPDAGRVLLGERDLTRASPSARARAGLGRSFQDARLFPSLTVEETIATACERWVKVRDPLSAAFRLPNAYDSERAVARRVDELVELLGLDRYRTLFIGELSTGTRRVVDLACLLAHEPEVVLLDEPAAGIAQREVEALAPLIRRIRDETGASLVVVEHDIPLIESVADRLVAMDQGRVLATGDARSVLAHPDVVASYLGTEGGGAVRRSGEITPERPSR
jgi:ABC-type branched-subunit amino acid transport system ATPase component/branched-subunit amino acid ABC-type transport system permease component